MHVRMIDPARVGELADLMNRNCGLERNRFTPELLKLIKYAK